LADRVSALAAGTTAPAGRTCGEIEAGFPAPIDTASSPTTQPSFTVEASGPQDVLEGVWRLTIDRQFILDQGFSAQEAGANAGVWTITINDNIATVDQPNGPDCTWEFAFHDSAVSLDMGALGNDACFGRMAGTYVRDGDVVMFHFDREREYDVAFDNAFFNGGMQKIG